MSSTFTSKFHLCICRFAWAYGSLAGVGKQILKFESNKVIRTWKTKIQKLRKPQRRKPKLLCNFLLQNVLSPKPCRVKCGETKCKVKLRGKRVSWDFGSLGELKRKRWKFRHHQRARTKVNTSGFHKKTKKSTP